MTVKPVVIGAFRTVSKGLGKRLREQEVRGRIETMKIIAVLRLIRILRRVLGTCEDWLSHTHTHFS